MRNRVMRAVVTPLAAAAALAATALPPVAGATAQTVSAQSTTLGRVTAFGAARKVGPAAGATSTARTVAIAAMPDGQGYWLAAADGGVFSYGDARFYGSTGGIALVAPIAGMAPTPTGRGYWLVASDGGVFSYGNAGFHGSTGGVNLVQPIVGMAASPDGGGYWLVASDGGVFAFGDAHFYGSTGGVALAAPIVGMAATRTGHGYWLVASDGGIFAFGDARFYGSAGGANPSQPVVGMAATGDSGGYWMVTRAGRVLHYGDAAYYGSASNLAPTQPVIGLAPAAGGYWVAQRAPYSTPFIPDLVSYLQSLPETTTAAVEDLDTGMIYTYNPGPSLILGSTVKVEILGTLLSEAQATGRWLTPREVQLATAMIEVSDNSAGQALFDEVGGAAAIQAWDQSVGTTGTFVYPSWGVSTSTAVDELTLLKVYDAPNPFLTEPYRQFGLYLLAHVELSQIFGVNSGPPESGVLAVKTGRMPGFGASNSIGWIRSEGRDYLIAVLVQNGPSDQMDEAAEDAVSFDSWWKLGP